MGLTIPCCWWLELPLLLLLLEAGRVLGRNEDVRYQSHADVMLHVITYMYLMVASADEVIDVGSPEGRHRLLTLNSCLV